MKQLLIIGAILVSATIGFYATKSDSGQIGAANGTQDQPAGDSQVLELTAKQGYTPAAIEAKANQSSVLRIATNNTFDCSSALRIPALKVSKQLTPNGITEIPIPAQEPGTQLAGTCGMGMYSFTIKFS